MIACVYITVAVVFTQYSVVSLENLSSHFAYEHLMAHYVDFKHPRAITHHMLDVSHVHDVLTAKE